MELPEVDSPEDFLVLVPEVAEVDPSPVIPEVVPEELELLVVLPPVVVVPVVVPFPDNVRSTFLSPS